MGHVMPPEIVVVAGEARIIRSAFPKEQSLFNYAILAAMVSLGLGGKMLGGVTTRCVCDMGVVSRQPISLSTGLSMLSCIFAG
ncbi:hypothetical protein L861_16085 [Litchfieldella anticariensis FP35 = DSM 16096]|uniref:Uncharacterized protein n=2 Tax=Litchfieldella anticariensis TaxID=258591 RepID=S2KJA0_LITA3|nr:hypothetical protein L861_16085 [Halomonas anticariensis FP35 = DSM 16096]